MTLNPADLDRSVDPGTDFYRFANGGWLDAHPIPAGYGAWGSFEEINERNESILLELLEAAATAPADDLDRMLGDFFASGMDVASIEAGGIEPARRLLDLADGIVSRSDALELLPELHAVGLFAFFGWSVTPDFDDSGRNLLWLVQAGLGLPDRDAYFAEDHTGRSLRTAYVDHVTAQLVNLGGTDEQSRTLAQEVLELETRLATLHLRGEQKRDPAQTLNRHDAGDLESLAPQLALPRYLTQLGAKAARTVNVQNPAYLAGLHEIVSQTTVPTLRAYLQFLVVRELADALPSRFDDAAFAFYGRRVRGQKEQLARPKRVISAITSDVGEALSRRFVERTFPPPAKQRALEMVTAILEQMGDSLRTREWMGDRTRDRGLTKLAAMGVKIGYPDRWRDWSGLAIDRSSFAANRLNAARFEAERLLAKLDQPVDTVEWELPPHVVNAYYHPTRNEIVFPAGILQPPLFDAAADDAVNFGAIGTVIGHEITHGFDDQGRHFDADGAFRDWWTPEDLERFTGLGDRLVAQYDEYLAAGDLHVNGRLTLGENIADLGGVTLAHAALHRVGTRDLQIDGLTPAQRFFVAYATVWRANISEELERTLAQADPHSPRRLRVVGPLSNMSSFSGAFDLSTDAPMLRPHDQRIAIW